MARPAAERTQIIEERKRKQPYQARLWVRDDWREFDVWSVPVDALLLNVDNRRFSAERSLLEDKLERALDPENRPEDETAIEIVLCDYSFDTDEVGRVLGRGATGDYEALKNDWLRRGQETPLWIRPDGVVRNGNRRLAMIRRLRREGGAAGQLDYVDVVILEREDVDEVSLFDMEQREQLTENFKVRYDDINLLLAIRESALARDIDWFDSESLDRVSGELTTLVDKSKGEVLRDLNAIKYMDLFLEDAGQAGQHFKLIRTLERFRDIGRTMPTVLEEYPDDAERVLRLLFAAVRAQLPHQKIRALRALFRGDRELFDEVYAEVVDREQEWELSRTGEELADPEPAPEPPEIEDDEEEEGGPNVVNYPTVEVARSLNLAIDAYQSARTNDLVALLREVGNRLALLDDDPDRLRLAMEGDGSEEVREGISAIVAWANRYASLLDE